MNPVAAPGQRVARFTLLRVLARDAHATTWLAHDPRLDRDVVVKLLAASPQTPGVAAWLQGARAASRFMHPNVVPVFEADEADGQAYLVFEHVPGTTLADACTARTPMSPREAARVVVQVLDALAAGHAMGIVHGALTPHHVLLGDGGRARVTGFDLATFAPVGCQPPAAADDVVAAGRLLAAMLAAGTGRTAALVNEEGLHSIVLRSCAAEPASRFDSARAMHTALAAWLNAGDTAPDLAQGHGTLEFLLRRMRHKTDFPALSDSVVRIQRMATSESESLGNLTDEILKDVALTHKVLRMVNTVHFSHAGAGGVSTVSRAVALVGFAGIRNMALSVLLLEHMSDRAHAALLLEQFMRSLMAGTLAGELTPIARDSEDAFLGALFQDLGRLLTEYYLPEEAAQIRDLADGDGDGDGDGDRNAAALRVLGLGLDDLGVGVARAWGLPVNLQRAMRVPTGDVPGRAPETGVERLRWAGRAAYALTDALLGSDDTDATRALAPVAGHYSAVLGMSRADILIATQSARLRLAQTAQALGLHSPAGAASRRLLPAVVGKPAPTIAPVTPMALCSARPATAMLQRGLDALRQTHAAPPVLLQRLLEVMHRALGLRCVVCCLREAATGQLVGRLTVGPGAREMSAAFRILPSAMPGADLFAALCAKGADILIADAAVAPVASRLPAWYRQAVGAPTFLLLPMLSQGQPIGLIYADMAQAGSLVLAASDLSLLRALRDHAVAEISRQSEQ